MSALILYMQLPSASLCALVSVVMVHFIHGASSGAGDAFLVVTGSSQPKVYDRDGHELGEFVKGDMYIRDLRNTKGHLYRCCAGQWHPNDRCAVATARLCVLSSRELRWSIAD